jgi:hypothetical protein
MNFTTLSLAHDSLISVPSSRFECVIGSSVEFGAPANVCRWHSVVASKLTDRGVSVEDISDSEWHEAVEILSAITLATARYLKQCCSGDGHLPRFEDMSLSRAERKTAAKAHESAHVFPNSVPQLQIPSIRLQNSSRYREIMNELMSDIHFLSRCRLFEANRALLMRPCEVRSRVNRRSFVPFVEAIAASIPRITSLNISALLVLSAEFSFELMMAISHFLAHNSLVDAYIWAEIAA